LSHIIRGGRPVVPAKPNPTYCFSVVASDPTQRNGCVRRRVLYIMYIITNYVRNSILSHDRTYPSALPALPYRSQTFLQAILFVPKASVLRITYALYGPTNVCIIYCHYNIIV
jgi:hypothetical protein